MSFGPSGTRGYQDFQRVQNWDSAILYTDNGLSLNPPIGTPILDVSRYAYLAGLDSISAGIAAAGFDWYSDAIGSHTLGHRTVPLSGSMGWPAQYRLPNLGPFVAIVWNSPSGPVPTHSSFIFATNRFHPLELIPHGVNLIWTQLTAIAAGATLTIYPADYYAGPSLVWHNMPALLTAQWQYLDQGGTWFNFAQLIGTGANAITNLTMPAGAWRLNLTNNDTVSRSPTLVQTPSLTGSS